MIFFRLRFRYGFNTLSRSRLNPCPAPRSYGFYKTLKSLSFIVPDHLRLLETMSPKESKKKKSSCPNQKRKSLHSMDFDCWICLQPVVHYASRSVVLLGCRHQFHLDCIGSAINAWKGMHCPDCYQVDIPSSYVVDNSARYDAPICSICLEEIPGDGDGQRSMAHLSCAHCFHLDCIVPAFNAKGAMQCPNCRQVENGRWICTPQDAKDPERQRARALFLRAVRGYRDVRWPRAKSSRRVD